MIKYYIKVIIRNLLKIFWIFPIDKKKIYFESFGGKGINCNPWYLFKYLYEKHPDYKYVWLITNEPDSKIPGVTYVKKKTLRWVKEILTSKVIVTNCGLAAYIGYRKQQFLIDTWHGGGAQKRVGESSFALTKWQRFNAQKSLQYIAGILKYYVTSSRKFTEVMCQSMSVPIEKFLPVGMPRNDVFFDKHAVQNAYACVRQVLDFDGDTYIVLFAPTFRGGTVNMNSAYFNNRLDFNILRETLSKKIDKPIKILFRGHHSTRNYFDKQDFDLDVSTYHDMQELLCAADMMITDYSSSMWDYSLLYRPLFLFTPDIDDYKANRGFYTEPESWGFPICRRNEELVNAITNFDRQRFAAAVNKYHDNFGSYENGTATEKIGKLIENEMAK